MTTATDNTLLQILAVGVLLAFIVGGAFIG